MLKKEILISQTTKPFSGFDSRIQGTLTAERNGTTNTIGFMAGLFGECSSTEITSAYTGSTNLGKYISFGFCPSFVDHLSYTDVYVGRYRFNIQSISSTDVQTFLLYNKKGKLLTGYSFASCNDIAKYRSRSDVNAITECKRVVYPKIFLEEDFVWLKQFTEESQDLSGIALSTKPLEEREYDLNTELMNPDSRIVPTNLMEVGKTYDFTLEYKIDAIITEDGVQTF